MKHRILLLTLCSTMLAAPVLAQDNVIRVIHDDGTEDVLDLGGGAQTNAQPEVPVQDMATMPPAAVKAQGAKDIEDSAAALDKAVKKAVEESDAVANARAKSGGKVASAASEKSAKKAKSKKPKEEKLSEPVPEGAVSKYPASGGVGKPMIEPKDPTFEPGTEITKEMALRVALGYAPPAKSVEVLPRTYKERPIYVVRFRTDEGTEDILIDAQTGEPIWAN